VVVVVAHDPPAERFDALLAALACQDYPNYRVLVIDSGRVMDPTDQVLRVLPDARVVQVPSHLGLGAAANHVLDLVDGAGFYVFSHDDVVPEPDALSQLVDAAQTWSAAVVGPKLVDWDDPSRLRQVGVAVDRIGVTMPFAEPGELDQAQHDGLREVVTVPGAFTLVDARLFERIGGFDEAITFLDDDLSMCWRARVAGARVLVASSAKVRHAEALDEWVTPDERRRLQGRHRLRALLSCYSLFSLVLVVPQALAMTLGESVAAVVSGRLGRARDALGAWLWNLHRLRSLRQARRHVRSIRRVPDRRIRRLQVRGLIGPRLQLRRVGGEARLQAARLETGAPPVALEPEENERARWTAGSFVVWLAIAGVLSFGSRHLITRFVPAVGELVPLDASSSALLSEWASGWRNTGLGSTTAAPPVLGALGGVAALLGSQMGLVRTVLTLGLVPLGVVGAHRLLRPAGSRRAQVAAAVAYAAVPVPYNALVAGHWTALAAYAGAPWLLGRLARAAGDAPFRPSDAPLVVMPYRLHLHVVAIGVLTAAMGLLVPVAPALLLLMGAALAVGSLLAFRSRGVARLAVATVGGAAVALVLHLPQTVDLVGSGARVEAWLGGSGPTTDVSVLGILRFETGQFGASPLGYALLVAAAAPLLVGQSWRLEWAIRGWAVAVASWGLVWVQQEGWLDRPLPPADVLLAPAAAGLAMAAAMGIAAIEEDLAGRSWRLRFRRLLAATGALGLAASAAPVVGAAVDGWWRMPHGDFRGVMGSVEQDVAEVPSRILWLGDPAVLPGAGWEWRDGIRYTTSLEGGLGVRDLWPGPADGATARVTEALDIAVDRRTTRLGRLLAPLGVQYIAVPERAAPSPYTDDQHPLPRSMSTALGAQLDLELMDLEPAMTVYRNTAFAPVRSLVADTSVLDGTEVEAAQRIDLSQSFPVLPDGDGLGYRGTLPPGFTMVHESSAGRWQLSIDGEDAERRSAYGWASAFDTGRGGDAVLSYRTSNGFRLLLALQIGLWLAALLAVLRMRFVPKGSTSPPPPGREPTRGEPPALEAPIPVGVAPEHVTPELEPAGRSGRGGGDLVPAMRWDGERR
jgi:GT2 family glycosyltransferase